jgi:helix-turn-helix protein
MTMHNIRKTLLSHILQYIKECEKKQLISLTEREKNIIIKLQNTAIHDDKLKKYLSNDRYDIQTNIVLFLNIVERELKKNEC